MSDSAFLREQFRLFCNRNQISGEGTQQYVLARTAFWAGSQVTSREVSMQDSAEREARSEHPPADVEEAARRLLKWQEGRKFANADFFSTDQKMASDAITVATAYLSERTRREKMEEALNLSERQFRLYERSHREKAAMAPPDSRARDDALAKAETNKRFAEAARASRESPQ